MVAPAGAAARQVANAATEASRATEFIDPLPGRPAADPPAKAFPEQGLRKIHAGPTREAESHRRRVKPRDARSGAVRWKKSSARIEEEFFPRRRIVPRSSQGEPTSGSGQH